MTSAITVFAMTPPSPQEARRLLAAVKAAKLEAEELHQRAKDVRRVAVTEAMDAGVTASEIADFLGVARSRVYQMRHGK